MSEEILKALIQLFAIISKQGGGVTKREREYVINFFEEQLSHESIDQYVALYDKYSTSGEISTNSTSLQDSLKTLEVGKKINKTLTQKQKTIALIEVLGLINSDDNVSDQEISILDSISAVFNISINDLDFIKGFVTNKNLDSFNTTNALKVDANDSNGFNYQHIHSKISGNLTFIWIESVDMYFVKYVGAEEITLNYLEMNPDKSYLFSVGSTVKLPNGDSIYYSDIISKFNIKNGENALSFVAENVEYKFPKGDLGLHGINIAETGGNLVGIMGASGSGKSTLLRTLSGIYKPSKGVVRLNSIDVFENPDQIEGLIGFVPQDDLLIEELTVYQNLYYNAKLSISHLPEDEIIAKVNKSLSDLGLEKTRDLKVGNPLHQKISGGQRKRLNIALELIRQPSILFVDEPTSGLSSRGSENVIDLLKELSLLGKLIFVVIHQPSSDIYKMFDKVVIMDMGGRQIYYGRPLEAISYFKTVAKQIDSSKVNCERCGAVNPEQIFNIVEARVVDEFGNLSNKRKINPVKWHAFYNENNINNPIQEVSEPPVSNFRIPNKLNQFKIFTQRDVLSKVSDKQYMIVNLLEAPLLAFILSYIIRYTNSPSGTYMFRYNDNIPAFFLMSIVVALFIGLSVSADEIIKDHKIRLREKFLNLSNMSYLLSKLGILFTLSAVQMLMFVVIGEWILEIKGMLFSFWFMLFSSACLANIIGLNISASFKSTITVYIIIPVILIPQMILSGLLFDFDKLNPSISATKYVPIIGDVMASRWALEALVVDQFTNNSYQKPIQEIDAARQNANYKTAFWIKEVENILSFITNNHESNDLQIIKKVDDKIKLIKHEFRHEDFKLEGVRESSIDSLLNRRDMSKQSFDLLYGYIKAIEKRYYNIYVNASIKKDEVIKKMKSNGADIIELKNEYYNEGISDLVRNVNSKSRIVEFQNELIRKVDPIYFISNHKYPYNYRSHYFAPAKLLFNIKIDTYLFNTVVIWLMSLVFFITLYYNVFNKLINFISQLFK